MLLFRMSCNPVCGYVFVQVYGADVSWLRGRVLELRISSSSITPWISYSLNNKGVWVNRLI